MDSDLAVPELSVTELPQPIHEKGRFRMPWDMIEPSLSKVMRFLLIEKDNSNVPSNEAELNEKLPLSQLNQTEVSQPPDGDDIRVTWLGHATVLLQLSGISVLTDPVFSDKIGPCGLRHLPGTPRRYRHCPCSVQQLPEIDAVVVSHNHYDHLDHGSVVELNKRFGDKLTWYVPTGMKTWMSASGCQNVVELGWWQEASLTKSGKEIKFVCVPAVHWSKRGVTDTNKILWGGWCVIGPLRKFYFAGDTGYHKDLFKLIGKKYGPFDLAAIPIGAYEPRWMMECHHVNPDEAFKIHKDINAYNSIGIHWGTFKLSYEPYLEPKEKIIELQRKETLENGRLGFFIENLGISRILKGWPLLPANGQMESTSHQQSDNK